jgi:glucokinase
MLEVDDLVEDVVEEALAQQCQLEICVGNADLDVMGRIGPCCAIERSRSPAGGRRHRRHQGPGDRHRPGGSPEGGGRGARRDTRTAAHDVMDAIAGVVRELGDRAGVGPEGLAGVGVGIAGLVDRDGLLHVGPNLPGLLDVNVGEELERALGRHVRVDNDATCAAWGEHLAGRRPRGLTTRCASRSGPGSAPDWWPRASWCAGAHGFGGEAWTHDRRPPGPAGAPAGRRGCWERFASGSGLGWLGREAAEAGRFPRGISRWPRGVAEHVRGEDVTPRRG